MLACGYGSKQDTVYTKKNINQTLWIFWWAIFLSQTCAANLCIDPGKGFLCLEESKSFIKVLDGKKNYLCLLLGAFDASCSYCGPICQTLEKTSLTKQTFQNHPNKLTYFLASWFGKENLPQVKKVVMHPAFDPSMQFASTGKGGFTRKPECVKGTFV